MRVKAIVGERGQVTIPRVLRDKLGIKPGTALVFTARNGTLVVRKAESDPVAKVFGCLKSPVDTERYLREVRGKPDLPE